MVRTLRENRRLVFDLTRSELHESVVGSVLGRVWLYLGPLLTMAVYIFVFAIVFRVKVNPTEGNFSYGYPAYILSGLIPWMMTLDIMARSCSAIIGNSGVVKEVVFPIEALPAKVVLTSAASFAVSYVVFFGYLLVEQGHLLVTHLLFPVVLGIQFVFLFGLAFLFAAITPFFRDMTRIVQFASMLLIYAAPIVYFGDWVPRAFRAVLYLNPISYMTWCFRMRCFMDRSCIRGPGLCSR